MTRTEALARAQTILTGTNFSKEDASRVRELLAYAQTVSPGQAQIYEARRRMAAGLPVVEEAQDDLELQAFRGYLTRGAESLSPGERATLRPAAARRDMVSSPGAYPGSTGGYFTPVQFVEQVWSMLRATDDLFRPDVVSVIETTKGGPSSIPNLDDTEVAATQVGQGQYSVLAEPVMGALTFGTCPTWRSGMCKISFEFEEDSGIPIDTTLARAFAIRFARGVGAFNVAALMTAASQNTITAEGSKVNDGGSEDGSTSIGSDDLYNLMGTLDSAYLASPKCAWVMNFSTLIAIARLRDTAGRPLKLVQGDAAGNLSLLFKPVRICPSMAPIGTTGSPPVGNTPVALGDLSRLIMRRVKDGMWVLRDVETYAEYGQLGFQGFLRSDAGLQITPGAPCPFAFLQNTPS